MPDIKKIKEAILNENLSGWLFFNFRHRDPISDTILEVNTDCINSRGWFYIVFPDRDPLKILHRVEPHILDHLPGEVSEYTSRDELKNILSQFKNKTFAAQCDRDLTTLSFIDAGTEELLRLSGVLTKSAASLIQRKLGILDINQITSHEKAAENLYSIIDKTWNLVKHSFNSEEKITEKILSDFIYREFSKNNLETEHSILVAFGENTADPHYETATKDSFLKRNTLVQFDIWAKEKKDNSVYADISWVGFTGENVPDQYNDVFKTLATARDYAVSMVDEKLKSGEAVTGSEVDRKVRNILTEAGYCREIRHRTGHSIDQELHGYGVNIDSVEFPDNRFILEGSCFSIEPGLYFPDFGMRTEIDCYVKNSSLIISGSLPQKKILTL